MKKYIFLLLLSSSLYGMQNWDCGPYPEVDAPEIDMSDLIDISMISIGDYDLELPASLENYFNENWED